MPPPALPLALHYPRTYTVMLLLPWPFLSIAQRLRPALPLLTYVYVRGETILLIVYTRTHAACPFCSFPLSFLDVVPSSFYIHIHTLLFFINTRLLAFCTDTFFFFL